VGQVVQWRASTLARVQEIHQERQLIVSEVPPQSSLLAGLASLDLRAPELTSSEIMSVHRHENHLDSFVQQRRRNYGASAMKEFVPHAGDAFILHMLIHALGGWGDHHAEKGGGCAGADDAPAHTTRPDDAEQLRAGLLQQAFPGRLAPARQSQHGRG
jgi:hypothetical protein